MTERRIKAVRTVTKNYMSILGILRAVLMAFRLPFRIGQCMEMKGTP